MTSGERPRPSRIEPREVAELRALKTRFPDLAPAIDMQVELVDLNKRLQARVSTQAPAPLAERQARLARGGRVVEFDDIPVEWSDARLAVRQVADILRRYDLLEASDHRRLAGLAREGDELPPHARNWYAETAQGPDTIANSPARPALLDDLLALAFKPYLARAGEVARQGLALDDWRRPWCPFCGAPPDFAVYQHDDDRRLICGRCTGRWEWKALGCPWCDNVDPRRLPAFTSADRRYRVCACDQCHRYLKAYNSQGAPRPVLPEVDAIATLPLDAAAAQRGYIGS